MPMQRDIGKFESSTSRATTTSTRSDFSHRLSFLKPFAEQYWLPFNHAAHSDARSALRQFNGIGARAGGRERYVALACAGGLRQN